MDNRIQDMVQKINEVNSSSNEDTTNWYDNKGKFLHYVLGRHILEHCHVKRLGDVMYIYNEDKRYIC